MIEHSFAGGKTRAARALGKAGPVAPSVAALAPVLVFLLPPVGRGAGRSGSTPEFRYPFNLVFKMDESWYASEYHDWLQDTWVGHRDGVKAWLSGAGAPVEDEGVLDPSVSFLAHYQLAAVLVRKGTSAAAGHYVVYGYASEAARWFLYDGATVSVVKNHTTVLNHQAYMLFYNLQSGKPPKLSQRQMKELEAYLASRGSGDE